MIAPLGMALLLMIGSGCAAQGQVWRRLEAEGMAVEWRHGDGLTHFRLEAPTQGWVAVGFNTSGDIAGAYLLMGHVKEGTPRMEERYTEAPGRYPSLEQYEVSLRVEQLRGSESGQGTRLEFAVPSEPGSVYHRPLTKGTECWMVLAYSWEDDFGHHSAMRRHVKVRL